MKYRQNTHTHAINISCIHINTMHTHTYQFNIVTIQSLYIGNDINIIHTYTHTYDTIYTHIHTSIKNTHSYIQYM